MGSPTIRLRCCWPECAHEWDGTYTATDYTSCPRCHASFSFRKPITLTPTPPAPADDAPGEVFVYRPASWKGQAPDDAKGRDDVKWVCRRADDASGAEAAACVAPAHDMAPRIVVEPYGTSCWQVWLHIGAASWTVGDYRRDKDAAERFAEPLRHALRAALAAPLPATDDAVEEAARLREALLAQRKAWLDLPACGGTYCDEPDESGRMDCCQDATYHAAGEAIRAIDAALRREKESRSDDSRPASGQGGA